MYLYQKHAEQHVCTHTTKYEDMYHAYIMKTYDYFSSKLTDPSYYYFG